MKEDQNWGSTCGDLILREIREGGPLTFARYMELALYAPGCGYYARHAGRVGRSGDFFTSASVGSAFGAGLAQQFEEMWEALGRPGNFDVVEQGANDGAVAGDILASAAGAFGEALRYTIVEPIARIAEIQQARLGEHAGRLAWATDLETPGAFEGVHFSNELVDAMPFHLIVSEHGVWRELHVGESDGRLYFLRGDVSPQAAEDAYRLPASEDGNMAEVRPLATQWIRQVATALRRGYLLTIDYGMTSERLRDPARRRGTFACYSGHKRDEEPLLAPGSKDITAHVDFSALAEAGLAAGLEPLGFCDQQHFLTRAAVPILQGLDGRPDHPFWGQLKTLFHPDLLGSKFHVFCMGKGVDVVPSGFHGRKWSLATRG